MVLFQTISSRRRRYTLSSRHAYTDDSAAAAAAITKSIDNDEDKHHVPKFRIYRQTTSCKSILMIGAALALMTFLLLQMLHANFRPFYYLRQQNDSSGIQIQLTETILEAGSLDANMAAATTNEGEEASGVAETKKVMDEPVASENILAIEEKEVTDTVAAGIEEAPPNLKYTAELAARAVEPTVWTCGEKGRQKTLDPVTHQRPFFAFVHVYKTAGSTMRDFFREFATVCKKSLALVISCHGSDIEKCKLKASLNAPQSIQSVNGTILHDHFDILGGHFSFGMADAIFSNANSTPNGAPQVRYMVFLLQPLTRFISSILYKQNRGDEHRQNTVEETAEYIKTRIRSSRENGEYLCSIYKYLLTPEQREMKYEQEQTHKEMVAHKAQLSIDNLVTYNAIVGMTEMFPQSMEIFEQVMGQIDTSARKEEEEEQDLFSRYIGEEVTRNVSNRKGITTSSVLKELSKDDAFMAIFREFVKYEQMIVDFAMDMHQKQYEAVKKGHFQHNTSRRSDEPSIQASS